MPQRPHTRFDFRKGVVSSHSEDILDRQELVSAQNARLGYGSIDKRAGTQRLHDTAIASAADVLGLHQWDAPAVDKQVVAVAGGNFYHFNPASDTDFTEISSSLSSSARPWFAAHIESGTPVLYFADGALRKWDGTTLTTSISGAPSATAVAVYKTRLFAIDGSKTIYWSVVADPDDWSSVNGGGSARVETYDTEGLVGLAKYGSSLLLFKEDNIARYTGVSASEIRIEQESEGVSPEVGCVAAQTIVEFEKGVFFLSDRGPYVANEAQAVPIGIQIEDQIMDAATSAWSNAVAVHNRRRKEIWLFFPGSGDTENTVGWCWNYRLGGWTGPWSLSFNVCSAARFELTSELESVMLGGYDGFVRDGDVESVGAVDDVLRAGTGGSNVSMIVEWPDLVFDDPERIKLLNPTQWIAANLKTNGSMTTSFAGDGKSAQTQAIASDGDGEKMYQLRPGTTGRRITFKITEATDEIVKIHGFRFLADMGTRAA